MNTARIVSNLLVFLFVGSFSTLCAALEWDSTFLKVKSGIGETSVPFVFKFKNAGEYSIRLLKPEASCGCTVATLEKDEYLPGESGEIHGLYRIKGVRGTQVVSIYVKSLSTVDGREVFRSDKVKISITIPELVKVSPGIIAWKKGDPVLPKSATLTVAEGIFLPLRLVEIENGIFTGEMEEIELGKKYTISLKPSPTVAQEGGRSIVVIEGLRGGGTPVRYYIHLMVR